MGNSLIAQDAMGRRVSLLNDSEEAPVVPRPTIPTRPSLSRPARLGSPGAYSREAEAPIYSPQVSGYGPLIPASSSYSTVYGPPSSAYGPPSQAYGSSRASGYGPPSAGTGSTPPTPELLRSDSYDSRMTAEPLSPMTPLYEPSVRHRPSAYDSRFPYDDYYTDFPAPFPSRKRRPSTFSDGPSVSYEDERGSPPVVGPCLTNEKPPAKRFACRYRDSHGCDKTFTTSGHASRHSKIHTAEKAVPCSFQGCPKKFTRADNMKQHLETHYKDKSRTAASRPSLSLRQRRTSSSGKPPSPTSSRSRAPSTSEAPAMYSPLTSPDVGPGDMRRLHDRPVSESRSGQLGEDEPTDGLRALVMVAERKRREMD